eukprot:gb/GFBE01035794.1/.p1 GENE.gb/GFBE01035794.1/~~gb/GFBE01035794.1/.p1  ORF type:complete len:202 (+),score=36.75 gb/GFBE01035794.1/:1-606(+)
MASTSGESPQTCLTDRPFMGWLEKRKTRSGYASRLWGETNRRYFTLDFPGQLFFYAHSEGSKQVSKPIPFKSLASVEPYGAAETEDRDLPALTRSNSKSSLASGWGFRVGRQLPAARQHGFVVHYMKSAQDHSLAKLELFCSTQAEEEQWIAALDAAIHVAGMRHEAAYDAAADPGGAASDISTVEGSLSERSEASSKQEE